jgi:hypothetical protein
VGADADAGAGADADAEKRTSTVFFQTLFEGLESFVERARDGPGIAEHLRRLMYFADTKLREQANMFVRDALHEGLLVDALADAASNKWHESCIVEVDRDQNKVCWSDTVEKYDPLLWT